MMKKISFQFLFLFIGFQLYSQDNILDDIVADITYLASDELEGRMMGEKGEKLAAEYIRNRYIESGLKPMGEEDYFQYFNASIKTNPHSIAPSKKIRGINVIGYLDYSQKETIIIGAHYDHLGYGMFGSLNTGEAEVHNGADDNASGVSLLLSLIKVLKKHQSYNYLFIAFSGEEHGLFGSSYYAKNPTIDLEHVRFMLNFDMVGRLNTENNLAINGVGTSKEWMSLLKDNNSYNLKLKTSESGIGPSDYTSFYLQDIPVLHFFTGQHEDYHKPTDDVEKINFEGIILLREYISKIIIHSSRIDNFDFQETISNTRDTPKFTVTLGIMPDYLYDGIGLRIDGVTKGKTAYKHGIQKGDIVIKMASFNIIDIYAYMKVLSKYNSGDHIEMVIKRDKAEIKLEVVFD